MGTWIIWLSIRFLVHAVIRVIDINSRKMDIIDPHCPDLVHSDWVRDQTALVWSFGRRGHGSALGTRGGKQLTGEGGVLQTLAIMNEISSLIIDSWSEMECWYFRSAELRESAFYGIAWYLKQEEVNRPAFTDGRRVAREIKGISTKTWRIETIRDEGENWTRTIFHAK